MHPSSTPNEVIAEHVVSTPLASHLGVWRRYSDLDSSVELFGFPPSSSSSEFRRSPPRNARNRAPTSAMVDWLTGDANTPGCVIQFLDLEDIASSHASCKPFRDYISNPKHGNAFRARKDGLNVSAKQFHLATASKWLPRFLHALQVDNMQVEEEPAVLNFEQLSTFSHLKSLEIYAPPHLISCALFQASGQLLSLESLTIHCTAPGQGYAGEAPVARLREVCFAPLANCKQLTTFTMQLPFKFFCTRQQVLDLTACTSLTRLYCGQWCGSHEWFSDGNRSREDWIAEGIEKLHVLPLQELNLRGVDMLPVDLENLSKITTLTSVRPSSWSPAIQDQWALLLNFQQLQELDFKPYLPDMFDFHLPSPSPPPNFWSVLLQLSTLKKLELHCIRLSDEDLSELFQHLTQLVSLSLGSVQLESCTAFANAPPSLEHVHLNQVTTFEDRVFHFHVSLPVISNLRTLSIREDWIRMVEWPQSTEGTEPFQAMLAAFKFMLAKRMPNLGVENIHYANI